MNNDLEKGRSIFPENLPQKSQDHEKASLTPYDSSWDETTSQCPNSEFNFTSSSQISKKCSICSDHQIHLSNFCISHNYCKKCIDSPSLFTISKTCEKCANYLEGSKMTMSTTCSSQKVKPEIFDTSKTIQKNHYTSISPENLQSRTLNKKSLGVSTIWENLTSLLRRCIICSMKKNEYLKICSKHAICENCFKFVYDIENYSDLGCHDCEAFLAQNLPEEYYDNQIENNLKIKIEVKKCEKSQCFTDIHQEKNTNDEDLLVNQLFGEEKIINNQLSEYLGITESQEISKDNKCSQISWISPESMCEKCEGFEKVIGLLCNHNLCLNCISDSAIREIVEYEKSIEIKEDGNIKKFEYHCLVCRFVIDLPTRMILKYIEKNELLGYYKLDEEYFRSKLWPKLVIFDGVAFKDKF